MTTRLSLRGLCALLCALCVSSSLLAQAQIINLQATDTTGALRERGDFTAEVFRDGNDLAKASNPSDTTGFDPAAWRSDLSLVPGTDVYSISGADTAISTALTTERTASATLTNKDVSDPSNTLPVDGRQLGHLVATVPSGFTWTPDFSVYRHRNGEFYSSVVWPGLLPFYDVTLYVDVVHGSDSNGGTGWDDAFKGVDAAMGSSAYTNAVGGVRILLAAGFYETGNGINGASFSKPTALIGVGGMARLTQGVLASSLSFVQESSPNTSVYSVAFATKPVAVFDDYSGSEDHIGRPIRFTEVNSVAECHAAASRAWYWSGGTLYVKKGNSTAPDGFTVISENTYSKNIHSSANVLYAENIGFEYGAQAFTKNSGAASSTALAGAFVNCVFAHASGNGFEWGVNRRVYLYRCTAWNNGLDGFNYDNGDFLEESCVGSYNGWDTTSGTNNGSSAHGSVRIIRINGRYLFNEDRNIHDIGSSKSWNLGCSAGYAIDQGTSYESSNWVAGRPGEADATLMWLDDCMSEGSTGDLNAYGGSALRYRRTLVSGKTTTTDGAAVIEAY